MDRGAWWATVYDILQFLLPESTTSPLRSILDNQYDQGNIDRIDNIIKEKKKYNTFTIIRPLTHTLPFPTKLEISLVVIIILLKCIGNIKF